jgi:amino acid adenylation domain-containing protein
MRNVIDKKIFEIFEKIKVKDIKGSYESVFLTYDQKTKLIKELNNVFKINLKDELFSNKEISVNFISDILRNKIQNEVRSKNPIKIKPTPPKDRHPLSFAQKRFFILSKLEPDSPFYNINSVRSLEGKLDIPKVKKSFHSLIQRHESLRTNFKEMKGEPVQFVHPEPTTELKVKDLSKLPGKEKEKKKKEIIDKTTQSPYDLEKDPLLRMVLIKEGKVKDQANKKTNAEKYTLIISAHHIISDQWSMNILYKELSELYKAYLEDRQPDLPDLPIQYKDYAEWEQSPENKERLKEQEKFWLKELSGELPVLNLPTDKSRPPVQTYKGEVEYLELDLQVSNKIKELVRSKNSTLFIFLFSVFSILLHRITGQHDMIIGTPSSSRNIFELENVQGVFLNNLSLRIKISGSDHFFDVFEKVERIISRVNDNKDAPFERIVDMLNINRDLSSSPLFNTMFQVDNKTELDFFRLSGTRQTDFSFGEENTSKFDFGFRAREQKDGKVLLSIEYNTDIFYRNKIKKILHSFAFLSKNIAYNSGQKISQYQLVEPQEKKFLLNKVNNTYKYYPDQKTLHQIFEEQVKKTPDNIAVQFKEEKLTYKQLNQKSNRLAHYLRDKLKLKRNDRIAIIVGRDISLAVSVIAVHKAGGCCLFLDKKGSQERNIRVLKDAGAKFSISSHEKKEHRFLEKNINIKDLEIEKCSNKNPRNRNDSLDPSYIISTSGTTGLPKAAKITHKGVHNQILFKKNVFNLSDKDILCLNSGLNWIPVAHQFYPPLACGAKLVILPEDAVGDPFKLFHFIDNYNISAADISLNVMDMYLRYSKFKYPLSDLRYILCVSLEGGFDPVKARRFLRYYGNISLIYHYGLTENSGPAINTLVTKETNFFDVCEGEPNFNTQAYILDRYANFLPAGFVGDLYIGGDSLFKGYVNDKRERQKYFSPDPRQKNKSIYKTGDLAKMREDGRIEILGRADEQVKIRGYRIDLREIENKLTSKKEVEQAAVKTVQKKEEGKELVAYFTLKKGNNAKIEDIKDYLKQYLPEYMIPHYYVAMAELPLNKNGKVDKKNFPEPTENDFIKNEYCYPQTVTEKKLAGIWQNILNIKSIGRNDNFFNLGGHSLSAVQLSSRIKDEFQVAVSLKNIFRYNQLKELAVNIEEILKKQSERKDLIPIKINKTREKMYYELSIEQRRLWNAPQGKKQTGYHAPFISNFAGKLDVELLKDCVRKMMERHEIFRASFKIAKDSNGEERPVQLIKEKANFDFPVIDLSDKKKKQQEIALNKIIDEEAREVFDIEKDLLMRMNVIKMNNYNYKILLKTHSIIFDLWSILLFWRELPSFYYNNGLIEERKTLSDLTYKDYAEWQGSDNFKQIERRHHDFWRKILANGISMLDLPFDSMPAESTEVDIVATGYSFLDKKLANNIELLCYKYNITFFAFFNAVFFIFLGKISGHSDIVVDSFRTNRVVSELENVMGPIYNHMPIKGRICGHQKFSDFLLEVKENIEEAQANTFFYKFNDIDNLRNQKRTATGPLFNVIFDARDAKKMSKNNNGDGNFKIRSDERSYINYKSTHDLSFKAVHNKEGIDIFLDYKKSLFKKETINDFLEQIVDITRKAVYDDNIEINDLLQ